MTEAKNEVMERKRDLDMTKEKMDKLVDKLYLGRQDQSATISNSHQTTKFSISYMHACPTRLLGHAQSSMLQDDECLMQHIRRLFWL